MRTPRLLLALGLWTLGSGCNIFTLSARNLTEAPLDLLDNCRIDRRNHNWARDAWRQTRQANPDQTYSAHYGDGFVEGFADYLDAGGNGQPPVVPPYRYRRAGYLTPAGYQAAEDWLAGFRHGAEAAQASGLRKWNTAATTGVGIPDSGPPPQPPVPDAAVPPLPPPRPMPPAELLPPPTSAPGAQPVSSYHVLPWPAPPRGEAGPR
jgi:hypothetical protein